MSALSAAKAATLQCTRMKLRILIVLSFIWALATVMIVRSSYVSEAVCRCHAGWWFSLGSYNYEIELAVYSIHSTYSSKWVYFSNPEGAVLPMRRIRGDRSRFWFISWSTGDWLAETQGPLSDPCFGAFGYASPGQRIGISLHWIWLLTLCGPVLLIRRAIRRYGRARDGRFAAQDGNCRHCGYDVRATPLRCPECGSTDPLPWPLSNFERRLIDEALQSSTAAKARDRVR